jgi:hypothetical protein
MQQCIKIYYSYLYEAQYDLGDTAHYQEPKTALATYGVGGGRCQAHCA